MEKKKRNTKAKQLVIDALRSCDFALCNEDIEKKLPDRVDRVTVYRILQSFCDDGKVHKIVGDNGKTYYSLCRHCSEEYHHDDHPHFRCTECNTITCLDTMLSDQQIPEGYNVSTVTTFLTGLCAKCNKTIALSVLLFLYVSSGLPAA
ncbi:MAG: transcriptional repressor [Tannerella sp.]|jgi:Fe2+ or Zn2+ uptake regulation protein|nr:transcriptional repressor [Tannerella sp.]